nr:MAG TPA: hypothetical protein [Caudoviricetes sp.]
MRLIIYRALYSIIRSIQDRFMQSQHHHAKICRHLFRSY